MSGFTSLPQYFHNPNYMDQEFYQELINRTLNDWFRTDIGFFLPGLTDAQVLALTNLTPIPTQRIWINVDPASVAYTKLQYIDSTGIVQVVTST